MYFVVVVFQPRSDFSCSMRRVCICDEEYFSSDLFNEPFEKDEEDWRGEVLRENHKKEFSPIADSGDKVAAKTSAGDWYDWSLTFESIGAPN